MSEGRIEVNQSELIKATTDILNFCQDTGISELISYMAMVHIMKTMEKVNGFWHEQRPDA